MDCFLSNDIFAIKYKFMLAKTGHFKAETNRK
jgi:hypothetical protein